MRSQNFNSSCGPIREGFRPNLQPGPVFASDRGFGLIEMVLVVGIILIVTAMALPVAQTSLVNYRLRASVATVSGVIQSTRYQAISQGYPFQIVFDKTAGTYQLKSNPALDGVFANVGGVVPFGNSSVTLGANATLQFSPGGSVKATAGTTTFVLTVSGKTGTITVSNYGNVNVTYAM